MTRRWTYQYVNENTREDSRRDQVIRSSSGFRYYFLMPLYPLLVYWGLLWAAAILAGACLSFARFFWPQKEPC